MTHELIETTACAVRDLLLKGEISPDDLLEALERRIAEVDGIVNALPTLCFDRARGHADRLKGVPPDRRGPLAGIPVAIKDLADVQGVRSTQGSPIFADCVPEKSDILVENIEANGGIIYAKSNTPEFGAGANTFNEVFGRTLNPWNTEMSAAGSSGGAAVALATGMAWLAHGSDMGGSLRNPASFNNIVGMRPTPGRVAFTRGDMIDNMLGVEGPMARNVEDLALFFDAMVGDHPADPNSLPKENISYLEAARSGNRPVRVAVSMDLGITPVEPEVAEIVANAASKLEDAGIIIEEAHPDLSEAHECFQTLRGFYFAATKKTLLEQHRDKLKPEVIWNIEQGLALTADELARAEHQRAAMFQRTLAFFETYDLLITPATIVPPFPVENRYVESCNGVTFENYVEWLAIAYAISNIACPALAMPAGFTADSLPVGLQIAGPPRSEARILSAAHILEQMLGLTRLTPIDPRSD